MEPRLRPVDFIPRVGYRTFHQRAMRDVGRDNYARYLEGSSIASETTIPIYNPFFDDWKFQFMDIYHHHITALSDLLELVGKKTGF